MYINNKILIGKNEEQELFILPNMANRHGIITGASGSGKTITLKVMAEGFSDCGVPVFLADVKCDLAGCAVEGVPNENVEGRLQKLGIEGFDYKKFPVRFWDLYGMKGHPVRAKVSEIGPEILSIMLGLSEAQEGTLAIAFRVAEDENMPLVDLKDLRALLQYIGDKRSDYTLKYGNVASQSVGVIQRSLLTLENQGIANFFGEPALDINDFLIKAEDGRGTINILDAVELFKSPDLYASYLLWMLLKLYNTLPEVGDVDKPKIVFFFDEAHLLFKDMPSYRLKKITQIVKLIRSKGIGLYFISQAPNDIPDEISAQLGNRVQHTLRAYTPLEIKNVDAAANSFRTNPKFDTKKAILELGIGEALISFQNEKGEPNIVEKATILPPQSMMGTIDDMTRNKVINNSSLIGKYDEKIDNESAYEKIEKYTQEKTQKEEEEKQRILDEKREKEEEKKRIQEEKEALREQREKEREEKRLERERNNSYENKLKKKVINKAENKIIDKGLNSLFRRLFK